MSVESANVPGKSLLRRRQGTVACLRASFRRRKPCGHFQTLYKSSGLLRKKNCPPCGGSELVLFPLSGWIQKIALVPIFRSPLG